MSKADSYTVFWLHTQATMPCTRPIHRILGSRNAQIAIERRIYSGTKTNRIWLCLEKVLVLASNQAARKTVGEPATITLILIVFFVDKHHESIL